MVSTLMLMEKTKRNLPSVFVKKSKRASWILESRRIVCCRIFAFFSSSQMSELGAASSIVAANTHSKDGVT